VLSQLGEPRLPIVEVRLALSELSTPLNIGFMADLLS
jgi:hypothetical protein